MSSRNACESCGATYRPYFGRWWRTEHGSKWFCSPACEPKPLQ